jgi:hypothetical protein
MDHALHAVLAVWGNFYLVTGTAAAALTGLQFVVQSLMTANGTRSIGNGDPVDGISTFGTPTVVHFTAALVLSSLMSVPWPGYGSLRASLVVIAGAALAYSAVVLRMARRQRTYQPVAEDWIFHVVLPMAAYAALLLAGLRMGPSVEGPEFMIAGATLLLVCVGIHNAWDTVTFLTINALRAGPPDATHPPQPGGPGRRRGRGRR